MAGKLEDRVKDIIGVKECMSVWDKHVIRDAQLRNDLTQRVSREMRAFSSVKDASEYISRCLFAYYSRRIELAKALTQLEKTKLSEVGMTSDLASEIRQCLAQLSDIHVLLNNILRGTVDPEAVEDKSLCDDKYLASLANDISSQSGLFVGASHRFKAMMDEINSVERHISKLQDRAASFSHTAEADADKEVLARLERQLAELNETPEAKAENDKLEAMQDSLKHLVYNSAEYRDMSQQIDAQKKVVASFMKTPEAVLLKEKIKCQRKRVRAHSETPEALAAAALVDKRKQSLETLEQRLVREATQFCAIRNRILKIVERESDDIISRCHALPENVRDVFRCNPPTSAENITAINYKLAYRKEEK